MLVGSPKTRAGRDARIRAALAPVGWALLAAALVWVAWWFAVRTKDPPTEVHSLGIAARVLGGGTKAGRNLPAARSCPACATGADLMRFNPGDGLRVDMVISVHPHLFPWVYTPCGEATVDMVISGTRGFWEQHDRLWARATRSGPGKVVTQIAVGWDPATTITAPADVPAPANQRHSPARTGLVPGDPQAALHPGLYTDADITDPTGSIPFPASHPLGLRTQIVNWGDLHNAAESPLHLHFIANWLRPRGWGSCYVLLPSFLGNGSFQGTQNALDALTQTHLQGAREVRLESEAQPPSYGKVALMTTGSVSIADTTPPPVNFEASGYGTGGSELRRINGFVSGNAARLAPVWSCAPSDDLSYLNAKAPLGVPSSGSFIGGVCSAVAVVDAPGAGSARAIVLIILGVLIAIAFERLFASLWRRQSSAKAE